jgi:hypothetical protein
MKSMAPVPEIPFSELTPQHFQDAFLKRGMPLLMRGFLASWPAVGTWTPAALASRFGTVEVRPMRLNPRPQSSATSPYDETVAMTMAAFVESIANGIDPDCYLVAHSQVLREPALSALWDDMHFDPCWLDAAHKHAGVSFWMGPAGARTPLHFDLRDSLLAQVHGRKRVILAAPSEVTPPTSGLAGYAGVQVNGAAFAAVTLEAGDALFLPQHWWHEVTCLSASVSLSIGNFAWHPTLS